MKAKMVAFFSILLIVSILTVGMVVAYPTGYTLSSTGTGFAELSTEQYHSADQSVKMGTVTGSDIGNINFNGGPTLSSLTALSYWTYTVQGGTYDQLTAWINSAANGKDVMFAIKKQLQPVTV